jgi:hypothetical protein
MVGGMAGSPGLDKAKDDRPDSWTRRASQPVGRPDAPYSTRAWLPAGRRASFGVASNARGFGLERDLVALVICGSLRPSCGQLSSAERSPGHLWGIYAPIVARR